MFMCKDTHHFGSRNTMDDPVGVAVIKWIWATGQLMEMTRLFNWEFTCHFQLQP